MKILMVLGVLIVGVIIVCREWQEVSPQQNRKHFIVFTALLSISMMLWIFKVCGVNVGNPFTIMHQLNLF